MSIRVGIIGTGGIARSHADGYKQAGAQIVACTDVNPEAAGKFARNHGGQVYADYRALLREGAVAGVSICTPPVAHEEASVYAFGRNVHVLCEKPLAFDVAAAHRIRAAAAKSRALFMPAFRHRFLPAIVALRELIKSGQLGDIVLFNNIFCGPAFGMEQTWFTKKAIAGGGSILDTNSHSIDLFRFMVGEVVEQSGVMHRHFKTTDVEDAGILCVKAENGAVGALESSFVAGAGLAFIDVIGTKGQAHYDYYATPNEVRWRLTKDEEWTREAAGESWGFAEEIAHFLGAIEGKHPLAVTIEDGVRSMEIICAVYEKCGL